MIRSILSTFAAIAAVSLSPVVAGGPEWSRDFEKARTLASTSGKDLLVDFTGSDWCSWCIKLNKEVFDHNEFREGVKDTFVLVELDYPRDKTKVTDAERAQNEALLKTYPIKGYPTILLCDSTGKPYAATGYQAGGPEKYVADLKTLREQRVIRDAAFAKADAASGPEQAKQLVAALEAMKLDDALILGSYAGVVEKIKAADPSDSTGFLMKASVKQKMAAVLKEFGEIRKKNDFAAGHAFLDQTLAEKDLPEEVKQHLHGHKAALFMHQQKLPDAVRTLEAGVAIAPDSEVAPELTKFLEFARQKAADGATPPDKAAAPAKPAPTKSE